jgi:GT2 family glycosyltransferase
MSRPRVLHVITVYNGRAFVPRAIKSALRMDKSVADVDVLILDDASPEPGWSAELEAFCRAEGALYYCTPRNLGIPRNCNLGLLAALNNGYDYVTINNSDVIFPKNLISTLLRAFENNNVGSVTAWSNNVSIYTAPNEDPDKYLAHQDAIDFISETLATKFGNRVYDAPAGISFCIMIPTDVLKTVGINDPIFGRGYCEETDWSLRSLACGYRICVTTSAFVYHMGRGSNLSAGLVSGAHTTVPENEDIIDIRFPDFRKQCDDFFKNTDFWDARGEGIDALIQRAGEHYGWRLDTREGFVDDGSSDLVWAQCGPHTEGKLILRYRGFVQTFDAPASGLRQMIAQRFKREPQTVNGRPENQAENQADGGATAQFDLPDYPVGIHS